MDYSLHLQSHDWIIDEEIAQCSICGYQAYYGVVDVKCYGNYPEEIFGWADKDGELLDKSCAEIIMQDALE